MMSLVIFGADLSECMYFFFIELDMLVLSLVDLVARSCIPSTFNHDVVHVDDK